MSEEETLSSATFKDFTMPNRTSSGFFFVKFCIKRILTATEYCNLQ